MIRSGGASGPSTPVATVRDPVFACDHYYLGVFARLVVGLLATISLSAVVTIEYARRGLAGELGPIPGDGHHLPTEWREWALNATSVAEVGPDTFSLVTAYTLPVDPTLPVWQQYLGYVIGVLSWWPILLLLGLSGVVAVTAEYQSG